MKYFSPAFFLIICAILKISEERMLELISPAFFNSFQFIETETPSLGTALLSPGNGGCHVYKTYPASSVPTFATTKVDGKWSSPSSRHVETLLRQLDKGNEDWQTVFIITVRNFSDVLTTLEQLSWGNQYWVYLLVHPSLDAGGSRKKFQEEFKSMKAERFGERLSIASKTFILFPRGTNNVVYPLEGVSVYKLKDRLFMHNHVYKNPFSSDDILKERKLRQDFEQMVFIVVTVSRVGAWEYNTAEPTDDEQIKFSNGNLMAKAMTFISEALNFRLEAVTTDSFVGRDEDGNLTGMGSIVLSGEADISASASELLVWRKEHLSFMQPTFTSRIRGYMLVPPRSTSGNVFYSAFHFDTWKSLIGTVIGLAIFVASYAKLKKLSINGSGLENPSDERIANEALIWATGAVCQQGWYTSPDSVSLRIVFIMGYVVGLVCFIGYSATLVSMISTPKEPRKSLEEWNKMGWKIMADVSTFALSTVEEGTGLEFLWDLPVDSAMKSMLTEKSIYLSVPEVFNPIVRNHFRENGIRTCGKCEKCNVESDRAICLMIYHFPIHWSIVKATMFVKKQSPLTEFLQQKTVLLLQSGIHKRNYLQFFKQDAFYCGESDEADLRRPMELQDVFTTFFILFIGGAVSLSCLVGEIFFARNFKDRYKFRKQQRLHFYT